MKRHMFAVVTALFAFAILTSNGARAVEPGEMLKDPKLEERAREVSLNLRCLVCQNQSIDDSNAELAKDLRVLVREFITKGLSNEQTVDEIVSRYGEYVLLKPRIGMHTMILWFGPLFLLLLAGGYLFMHMRARPARPAVRESKALSSKEKADLAKLMKKD